MNIKQIEDKIKNEHFGDEKQLEIIFSKTNRLVIEAPAGYGKTKTMVSKIAYMLASNQIPYPKKLLALTFSVNAAYKIKKDVTENIPIILGSKEYNFNISDKISVSNYHGFARRILKKYGYKIYSNLSEIDKFQSIDDSKIENLTQFIPGLGFSNAEFLSNFNLAVKNVNGNFIKENIDNYNKIVIEKLLPLEVIPYNAILSLAYKLLKDYPVISGFYQKLYKTILVDEYQDTNALSYYLLNCLLSDNSNIILMGDSLQRIYGFIGAIPNLLSYSENKFKLERITLNKNYRFQYNKEMLILDKNIRINAENPVYPNISEVANIKCSLLNNQIEEAEYLINKSTDIISKNPDSKVAILVKQRGKNIEAIIENFNNNSIEFFYGLFSEDDSDYVKFNHECLFEFIELLRLKNQITKKITHTLIENIKKKNTKTDALTLSLFNLLEIFLSKVFSDFSFLSNDEKISLIKDTFENNGLKQYIEFVDSKIIISTIHGAKGLEWDFVIIPDMESNSFPNYWGLCGICRCSHNCKLIITKEIEPKFLEELSVFYVAVTRARKQVYFSASKTQINSRNQIARCNISCFLSLPGIQIKYEII